MKPGDAVFPPRVKWAVVMIDLTAAGWGPYRVSLCLGAALSTVQNWAEGAEPRYGYGDALLRLHAMVCGPELALKRRLESTDPSVVAGD